MKIQQLYDVTRRVVNAKSELDMAQDASVTLTIEHRTIRSLIAKLDKLETQLNKKCRRMEYEIRNKALP